MAEYPAIILTNAGLDMIAESQAGYNLIFTKLKIGDGLLGTGEGISTLTALKSPKLDIPIQGMMNQGNGQVRLRYLVDNSGVQVNQGFFAREVGVYAKLGEAGTERLYAYANGGNKVDWIPDKNTPMDAQIFDVFVLIGNASNVTVVIDGSATYATLLDLNEHIDDPNAHGLSSLYVPVAGGEMAGPLVLAANPEEPMEAATKQYADENGGINIWRANHTYADGDICYSKNAASYKYMECKVGGISGSVEPPWPAVGQLVTDGTATWAVRDIKGNGVPIGTITPRLALTPEPGELACDTGALVSRATYSQLWAWVQAYAPLITEAAWQAQAAVQSSVGYYSSGDGATTFRLPRLVDFIRGSDGVRLPGTWQEDVFKSHTHTLSVSGSGTPGTIGVFRTNSSDGFNAGYISTIGEAETRPRNITVLYCVKAFDAPTNQGLIDITELANEMSGKVNTTDFTSWGNDINGGRKLPDGTIIQWGDVVVSSFSETSYAATFPLAFPAACIKVIPVTNNPAASNQSGYFPQAVSKSPTGAVFFAQYAGAGDGTGTGFSYIAIGR